MIELSLGPATDHPHLIWPLIMLVGLGLLAYGLDQQRRSRKRASAKPSARGLPIEQQVLAHQQVSPWAGYMGGSAWGGHAASGVRMGMYYHVPGGQSVVLGPPYVTAKPVKVDL